MVIGTRNPLLDLLLVATAIVANAIYRYLRVREQR